MHQSYCTSSVSLPFFKLCGETATRQAAAFSFGTAYQQSVSVSSQLSHGDGRIVFFIIIVCVQCDLSVAELMSTYSEPLFYDVFMDLGGEEERKLFPLPTLVHNLQYNGQFINQGGIWFYEAQRGGPVHCF